MKLDNYEDVDDLAGIVGHHGGPSAVFKREENGKDAYYVADVDDERYLTRFYGFGSAFSYALGYAEGYDDSKEGDEN